MNDPIENTIEAIQQQLFLLQSLQMRQEHLLKLALRVIALSPELGEEFERLCFDELSAIGQKSPKAADELEQYLAQLLRDSAK